MIKVFVSFPQDKVDAGLPTAIVSINVFIYSTEPKRDDVSVKENIFFILLMVVFANLLLVFCPYWR